MYLEGHTYKIYSKDAPCDAAADYARHPAYVCVPVEHDTRTTIGGGTVTVEYCLHTVGRGSGKGTFQVTWNGNKQNNNNLKYIFITSKLNIAQKI